MSETVVFKDFSRKRSPIEFGIDGEIFAARKALGAAVLQDALSKFKDARKEGDDVTAENVMAKISAALELLLKPESHDRFMAVLLDKERDEPIDMAQLSEIFTWLIEQYALRPTPALSGSSSSSSTDNAGTDSPDGVQLPESTPLHSLSLDS